MAHEHEYQRFQPQPISLHGQHQSWNSWSSNRYLPTRPLSVLKQFSINPIVASAHRPLTERVNCFFVITEIFLRSVQRTARHNRYSLDHRKTVRNKYIADCMPLLRTT